MALVLILVLVKEAGASSSILDDYEIGTFQPTITVDSGSLSLDGGEDTCAYIKIGKLVQVQGSIGISGSGASGAFRIASLPFAMNTGLAEQAELSAATVNVYNTASNFTQGILGELSNVSGDATILIRQGNGTSAGVTNVADKMDSGTFNCFMATYRTDS